MDYHKLIVSNWKEASISIQMVKQCVNFSDSKPRTPLFLAASLAMQINLAIMFGRFSYILTDFNYATLTSPYIFQKTVECKLPLLL